MFYKYKDVLMKLALSMLFVGMCFGACSVINDKLGLQDDHPLEEAMEDVIEHHTGIDIDLTPEDG